MRTAEREDARVQSARVPAFARGAAVMCAAPRVGGSVWSVGGSIPAFRHEGMDEASVALHLDRLGGVGFVYALRLLYPQQLGGYKATRALLVERGYLTPFRKRAMETLAQTAARRMRTYEQRWRAGLPASVPNAVGLGAKRCVVVAR